MADLRIYFRGGPLDGKVLVVPYAYPGWAVHMQVPVYKQHGAFCELSIVDAYYRPADEQDPAGNEIFDYEDPEEEAKLKSKRDVWFSGVRERLEFMVTMYVNVDLAVRIRDRNLDAAYKKSRS
jgi:hypothetical protein